MSSSGVDIICLTYWSLSQSQTGVYHLIPLCGFIHSLALPQVLLFPSCSHVCSASNICLPTIPLPPSLPFSLPPPLRPNQTDRQVTPSACSPANQSVFFSPQKTSRGFLRTSFVPLPQLLAIFGTIIRLLQEWESFCPRTVF